MRFEAFFSLIILMSSLRAHAFPENVRHGYFNCTTCHVSPSGGGVLMPYGRALAAELMSTWGTPKRAGFLFSDVENEKRWPHWLRAQANFRSVQTVRNSPTVERARFIPMQADLEIGVDFNKFAFIYTAGFRADRDSQSDTLREYFSRRHFVMYSPTDSTILRAGKFMFSFGLNGPDHITATRRGLGWDQGSESYNLEANYLREKTATTFTLISKEPEESRSNRDRGVALNQSFLVAEKSRVGISAFSGKTADFERVVYGPYMTWSFTERVFLDSEIFLQDKRLRDSETRERGYATFHRLGWEVTKGIIPFTQFDRAYLNRSAPATKFDSYGAGLQWLPYPHFETTALLGKEKSANQGSTDFWWLMVNIYL